MLFFPSLRGGAEDSDEAISGESYCIFIGIAAGLPPLLKRRRGVYWWFFRHSEERQGLDEESLTGILYCVQDDEVEFSATEWGVRCCS